MKEYYIKFKGNKWCKGLGFCDGPEEFYQCSTKNSMPISLLIINEGENWKYKWMEDDDFNE